MNNLKEKPCKGTGKAKGFKGCGKSFIKRHYGLCSSCYRDWLLNTPEGNEQMRKMTIRGSKKAKAEFSKQSRIKAKKDKIDSMSIRALIIEVKEPFQKLIRIRDHRKPCICCNKPLPFNIGDYDAGHFKKAEVYSGLIFHPDNVHGQLVYCNKELDGNEGNYALNLPNRIGKERFDKLIDLSIKYKSYKWDRYVLIDMLKHYRSELRLVESGKKEPHEIDFSIGILE